MADSLMKEKDRGMEKLSRFILRLRWPLTVLFLLFAVYCAFSVGRVKINSNLADFLPEKTETKRGITVMQQEFSTYASARVMLEDTDLSTAGQAAQRLREIEHVADVSFDDTQTHFKDGYALLGVSFDGPGENAEVKEAWSKVQEELRPYTFHATSDVGSDYSRQLASEMGIVLLLASAVILVVLLLTSRSYFEILIFAAVFGMAALLNMGTNFWLGQISSITNSVAIILQLALAIDYAIIFSHRYAEEAQTVPDTKEALVQALSKSIVEISSSSLTTISGLVALMLMQFRLGRDMGVVLAKGILCSMLTVFLFMPALISFCPKLLAKTRHRSFIPRIEGWGRLLTKKVPVFLLLFALLLPFAIYGSSRVDYAFSNNGVTELVSNPERESQKKISRVFGSATAIALLVPAGRYDLEREILDEVGQLPKIESAMGLANLSYGSVSLTSPVCADDVSEMLGLDGEQARGLFTLYAIENGDYVLSFDPAVYRIPLVDLAAYLFEKMDLGAIPLNDEQQHAADAVRPNLQRALDQLRGEHYSRLVFSADVEVEGQESEALLASIRQIAARRYGEENVLLVGDITSAKDLRESYRSDSTETSLLSLLFVFLILLVTFRSPVAAALLVFVIQGSIWLNFSFAYLFGMRPFFVTNMIATAIQMGATIDYAIVILNHYRANRACLPKREAMVRAVAESFPTVLTSGAIMSVAGLLIAFRVSDVYVGHIGLVVGRGALISVILVLTVLPQLLLLCDTPIRVTTWKRKDKKKTEEKEEDEDGRSDENRDG